MSSLSVDTLPTSTNPTSLVYGNQPPNSKPIIVQVPVPPAQTPAVLDADRVSELKEIQRYETLKAIAQVMKVAGLVLMITGASAAALVFGLPVISVIVGTVLFTLPLFVATWVSHGLHDYTGPMMPLLSNGRGWGTYPGAISTAKMVTKFLWEAPVSLIYKSSVAATVGVACGVITGMGALLYGIGHCAENYCNNKISALKLSVPTNQ